MSDMSEYKCLKLNGCPAREVKEFLKAQKGLEKALFRDIYRCKGLELRVNGGQEFTFVEVSAADTARMDEATEMLEKYHGQPGRSAYVTDWEQGITW